MHAYNVQYSHKNEILISDTAEGFDAVAQWSEYIDALTCPLTSGMPRLHARRREDGIESMTSHWSETTPQCWKRPRLR